VNLVKLKKLFCPCIGAGLIFHFHQIVTKHSLYYPFVSFQPYFGQNPRATETWNITTIRAELHLNLDKENIQEATDLVRP
jgi:hypothetical protein